MCKRQVVVVFGWILHSGAEESDGGLDVWTPAFAEEEELRHGGMEEFARVFI